ncbi:MAG: hypothetical protein NVSMB18_28190 [Acetobacteraceae bacterium]
MRPPFALLLLLAGCAGSDATPEQACARQAYDDPAVQEIQRQNAGTEQLQWENQDKLRIARQEATLACLRGRGLIQKGGVERQRRL